MDGVIGLVILIGLAVVFIRTVDRLTEMSREQREMVRAIRRIEERLGHIEDAMRASVRPGD